MNKKSKKKLIIALLAIMGAVIVVCGIIVLPKLKFNLQYKEIEENGEVVAYSVSGIGIVTNSNIVIPATYKGKPVTSIGDGAFASYSRLKSITIPDSVTSIGQRAFYNPNNIVGIDDELTSVTIGNSVEIIGDQAFYNCNGLTSITIPDSVTSIGDSAFYDCSSLTSVTIGSGVTSIGDKAFSFSLASCNNLTSITVSEGNNVYHSNGNCLIETASKTLILGCNNSVIPTDGSVKSIGDQAFYSCRGLTSITIPDSVTSIGYRAFDDCRRLTSVTFVNTEGWWRAKSSTATSGTSISSAYLANPDDVAVLLTSTSYYLKRG